MLSSSKPFRTAAEKSGVPIKINFVISVPFKGFSYLNFLYYSIVIRYMKFCGS
ncbi:hypothetical protein SGADD02_01641 [Streptococcus gallolyticus]|uniref:Uncharacterized protein n=1 Tax=Streptococcus gallolyticus TaxID=315405 RepID=A0A139MSB5_9STRE|nr:hypothetical protein SGADD02_01641 [Streptococcus gallolyticus]